MMAPGSASPALRRPEPEVDRLRRELDDAQKEIDALSSLCVAALRLATVEDRDGALDALEEVLQNVVGSECFAIVASGASGRSELLRHRGIDAALHAAALRGGPPHPPPLCEVPVVRRGKALGAIQLFGLVPHKAALGRGDVWVLDMVAGLAAPILDPARSEPSP
jgi:hypothetical protein